MYHAHLRCSYLATDGIIGPPADSVCGPTHPPACIGQYEALFCAPNMWRRLVTRNGRRTGGKRFRRPRRDHMAGRSNARGALVMDLTPDALEIGSDRRDVRTSSIAPPRLWFSNLRLQSSDQCARQRQATPIFRYSLGSRSLTRSATKFSFCLKRIVPIMAMLAAALFVQLIGASGDIAVGRPDFASVRARNRIACSTRYRGLRCEDPERKDERGRLCIACIGKYV